MPNRNYTKQALWWVQEAEILDNTAWQMSNCNYPLVRGQDYAIHEVDMSSDEETLYNNGMKRNNQNHEGD